MRCAKCGTENASETRFCNQCATPLNRPCPKCAYENAPEAKFCGQCAAPFQADNVASQRPLGSSAATPETRPRRVGVALVLSLLFPGWGQIYNGQFRKALWIWGGWVIAGLCAAAVGLPATFPGLLGLLLASVVFYVLICVEAVVHARRLSLEPRRFRPNRWYAYLGFVAIVYVLNVSAALMSRTFFFQAYKIPAGSMEPTLLIGDHILVNKIVYGLRMPESIVGLKPPGIPYGRYLFQIEAVHRRDIVVFVFPPDRTKDFIKRVIGVGGDTVEVKGKAVYVNGQKLDEPYAHYEEGESGMSATPRDDFGPVTVPEGKLFVMGDNRDRSYDSRFWGFVDRSDVEGRALYIYWSWDADSSAVKPVRWQRIGPRLQ